MIYLLLKAKRNPHANIISYVNQEAEQNLHLQLNFYMPPIFSPFICTATGKIVTSRRISPPGGPVRTRVLD